MKDTVQSLATKVAFSFLEEYCERLDHVHSSRDLYGKLFAWQFAQQQRGAVANVQRVLNEYFFQSGHAAQKLDPQQPLTTAVGGVKGIVVVTANPHYSALNSYEQQLRRDRDGYTKFCESFFENTFSHHTQKIDWWRRVARFGHQVIEGRDESDLESIWKWARSGRIGAVDLLPFHSSRDGITRLTKLARVQRQGDKARLKGLLRDAAAATTRMVLRLRPPVVIVASREGSLLAENVLQEHVSIRRNEDLICEFGGGWKQAYHIHHFTATSTSTSGTEIFTFGAQLFSNRAGLNDLRKHSFPERIHGMLKRQHAPCT